MNTQSAVVSLILLLIHGSVLVLSMQRRKEALFMSIGSTVSESGQSIAYGDNGFYVCGYTGPGRNLAFNLTTSMVSNGGYDAFLAKYTNKGELLWGVGLGTPVVDYAYSVAASSDSVFMTGYSNGNLLGHTNAGPTDAFVVKYSSEGELKWSKLFGTSRPDVGNAIGVSSDGVYVAGGISGSLNVDGVQLTNTGSTDAYIFKLSPTTGTAIWGYCFGSVSDEQASGLAVGSDGSVVITGYSYGTITVGGQTATNAGRNDIFVIKYDTNGILQWLKGVGSSESDSGTAVAIDSEDNVYVVGHSRGTINTLPAIGDLDSIIIKYSSDGTVLWTRRLNCVLHDMATAVAVTSSGVVMVGYFTGSFTFAQTTVTSVGSQDAYVVEYSPNGDELWVASGGSNSIDYAFGATANGDDVFVTGRTNGAGKWGNFHGVYRDNSDAFVVRYSKDIEDCASDTYKNSPECTSVSACVTNLQCKCIDGYGGSYCSMDRKCNSILFDNSTVCSGHGMCVEVDNCTCTTGYTSDFCDVAICYDISAEEASVCSGHGSCTAPDSCDCSGSYYGSECENIFTCNGIAANESSVCSEHGECTGIDTCECESGWTGQYCEAPICFNKNATDTQNVCSGHGECVNVDECKCSGNWDGEKCDESVPLCYGISGKDVTVCSGRGRCIGSDNCVCAPPYAGYICQRKCDHCHVK